MVPLCIVLGPLCIGLTVWWNETGVLAAVPTSSAMRTMCMPATQNFPALSTIIAKLALTILSFFPRRYYACRNVRTLSASLRIFLKKYMGMVWKALSRGNSHVLSLDGGGFQCDIAGVEAGSGCSGWHKRKNGCGIPARSRHTMHRSKARTCDWDNRNNS